VSETFPSEQRFDEAGLRGRLASSSYAPRPDSPLYSPMMAELASVFHRHADREEVTLAYDTVIWHGPLD
jgi:hypothetical protein